MPPRALILATSILFISGAWLAQAKAARLQVVKDLDAAGFLALLASAPGFDAQEQTLKVRVLLSVRGSNPNVAPTTFL